MDILQKAATFRSSAQCLEHLIIGAVKVKGASDEAYIWHLMRQRVAEIELELRTLRSAVQAKKRATAKKCPHQGAGEEKKEFKNGAGGIQSAGAGLWRCKYCRQWTTVAPKAAAPQAVQA